MHDIILAAGADTIAKGTDFWGTTIGAWVQNILGAFGAIICIIALFKAAGKFLNGKIGDGVKIIILALVIAAICFAPEQIFTSLINTTKHLLLSGSDSVDKIGGTGDAGGGV